MLDAVLAHLKSESKVIAKAPVAFVVFLALGVGLGYLVATWYYNGRMADQDGLLARYRVALGIDKASQGVMIELTTEELRSKALTTASALREFALGTRNEMESQSRDAKDEQDRGRRTMAVLKRRSDMFDRRLKADTVLVDTELRAAPEAWASSGGIYRWRPGVVLLVQRRGAGHDNKPNTERKWYVGWLRWDPSGRD